MGDVLHAQIALVVRRIGASLVFLQVRQAIEVGVFSRVVSSWVSCFPRVRQAVPVAVGQHGEIEGAVLTGGDVPGQVADDDAPGSCGGGVGGGEGGVGLGAPG